jgi:two-component system, LytTR family, response regulator
VDYLLKPILFERFLKATAKAINLITLSQKETQALPQLAGAQDFIFVKTDIRGQLIKINLSEINYIEGLGNYAAIHTKDGKTLSLITFKELETKLPSSDFISIHKSFIIPIAKITAIEGYRVFIDKHVVPIGETYKEKLIEFLDRRIMSKQRKKSQ